MREETRVYHKTPRKNIERKSLATETLRDKDTHTNNKLSQLGTSQNLKEQLKSDKC